MLFLPGNSGNFKQSGSVVNCKDINSKLINNSVNDSVASPDQFSDVGKSVFRNNSSSFWVNFKEMNRFKKRLNNFPGISL